MTDEQELIEDLLISWESEIAEFATHNDPYYNGVRQCIQDLEAVLVDIEERSK